MIKKWHIKAIIQTCVSYLPYRSRINHLFQSVNGSTTLSDTTFLFKITHAMNHVVHYKQHYGVTDKTSVMELGTGWFAILPIYLYLCGFGKVWSIDVHDWLTKGNIFQTINKFAEWKEQGKLEPYSEHILPERWEQLMALREGSKEQALGELCARFNFYPKLADARHLVEFQDHSVNMICSNNTFEHISRDILRDILVEFKRVVRTDGVMSHHMDMTDHYAHFDSSINQYNFLRYEVARWRWYNNDIGYQNRMRFVDFCRLYDEIGLSYEVAKLSPGKPELIDESSLASCFQNYTLEELAVLGGYLLSYRFV